MPPRYQLKVTTDFAAAHTLEGYPGACARMHGHNWKVEVEVTASALDGIGMGMDFRDIRNAAREVCERLDHRYLNDIEPFDQVNPTAENIAAHIYRELAARLDSDHARVTAITLWETERACVRYTEDHTT